MSTKKLDVAQKSISCRQKQDDAASKKYFVRKKIIFFPERCTIKLPLNETVDIIFKKSLEKYYKTIVFLFK